MIKLAPLNTMNTRLMMKNNPLFGIADLYTIKTPHKFLNMIFKINTLIS